MRKNKILGVIIIAVCLQACKKDAESSFQNRILDNWRVIGDHSFRIDDGITVEWGLYYIGFLGLRSDHRFTVNEADEPTGTWKLIDNQKRIVFYSEYHDVVTTYRDTTEFRISINDNNELILEDDVRYFIHKRIR